MYEIRAAEVGDAAGLCQLFAQLPTETDFMLLEPGERTPTLVAQQQRLAQFSASSDQQMLIAVHPDDTVPVGFIVATREGLQRTAHRFSIVMGVLSAHRRQGLGKRLLQAIKAWVVEQGGQRIELTVHVDNTAAILLYQQSGFQIEGRRRHSLYVNHRYCDEWYMGQWLTPEPSGTILSKAMLPGDNVSGLNHITLAVTDLMRSIAFYETFLGFSPMVRWSSGAYLQLGELWLCLSEGKVTPREDYTHLAFSVDSAGMQQLAEDLRSNHIQEWQQNSSEGASLYFLDPDGHKLEVHVGNLASRLDSLKAKPYDELFWYSETAAGETKQ